jgi:hypothetical protein
VTGLGEFLPIGRFWDNFIPPSSLALILTRTVLVWKVLYYFVLWIIPCISLFADFLPFLSFSPNQGCQMVYF